MVEFRLPMFCSSCGAKNSPVGRFCSACGAALNHDAEATVLANDSVAEGLTIDPATPRMPLPPPTPAARTPSHRSAPRAPSGSAGSLLSSDPIGGGRFVPGQIVAERYRIVGLAGRGGLGGAFCAVDL